MNGAGGAALDEALAASLLPRRDPRGHKGTFGRVVAVSGSLDYAGAALMAGAAALRAGSGLVTVCVPASLQPHIAGRIPELITCGLPEGANGGVDADKAAADVLELPQDALLVGPGLKADGDTSRLVQRVLAGDGPAAVVDAALEQHAGDTDRVVTDALAVQPLTRWRKGELIRTGWRATRRSTVEVVGFDGLGSLLADVVGAGAMIAGPEWIVDDGNAAIDRVRVLAAHDARRRAEAYATGLGVTLGPLRWAAEPGLRTSSGEPPTRMMALAGSARGLAADEDPVIEIEPADTVVEASVEVSFGLGESG